MAIISTIGRKALPVRMLIGGIYLILSVGALTMIYPFLLMISGMTKSSVDTPESQLIPAFLKSDAALYAKDAESFFNESLAVYTSVALDTSPSFRDIIPPESVNAAFVGQWQEFLEKNSLPWYSYNLAYFAVIQSRGTIPLNLRRFKRELSRKFDGDLDRLNVSFDTDFSSWNSIVLSSRAYYAGTVPIANPPLPINQALREFTKSRPVSERYYLGLTGYYRVNFLQMIYTKDIAHFNETHGTSYESWDSLFLLEHFPAQGTEAEQEDWDNFVRMILNSIWIKADDSAKPLFSEFLEKKWGTIGELNRVYQVEYASFSEVPFPDENSREIAFADWTALIQGWTDTATGKEFKLPSESIYVDSVESRFQKYLKTSFASVAELNKECGTDFKSWKAVLPPQREFYWNNLQSRKSAARWEFCKRNVISVMEYIVLHGRGLSNTVIYCFLAILSALIINPMAAYALSRFKPPSTYKLLLFMMMTMAFPPMVTQIPVFLLLRQLNMLNSFYALILPGMANGYSIFLLKGFFDSLPQELYESAQIDGAGEFRIFWQITMSLSKPILAVIALNAFTLAYSNFMMALLICQDQNMWTIMPWLYQLQIRSTQGVVFASLVIAAIPTFIIFSLCQNIIMRGIVVPVEK